MPNFDFQPTLIGSQIELLPLRAQDFEALKAAARDLDTWKAYPSKSVRQTGDISPWFPQGVAQAKALAIRERTSKKIIGTTRYYRASDAPNAIGIGFTFLVSRHQGTGTNGQVKSLMFDHAFKSWPQISFHVLPDNLRSQAAVKKLGATCVGTQRLQLTDQARDYVCYLLNRPD